MDARKWGGEKVKKIKIKIHVRDDELYKKMR